MSNEATSPEAENPSSPLNDPLQSSNLQVALLLALAAGATFFVYLDAWVSDDALITFRYVDNFLHGHGASFNPGDKVQGYTHPLWFMLLSAVTLVSGDEIYSAVLLGLLLTFVTGIGLALLLADQARDRITALAATAVVLVLFCISEAWRSFQTSGLEGSLSTLLLVLFVIEAYRDAIRPWALLLLGALLVLCRPDFLLLVAPTCSYAALEVWRSKRFAGAALALAPLLWFLVAKVYYGSFLPNTGAAKLGIYSVAEGVTQGLTYLGDWLSHEPVTAAAALVLLAFSIWQRPRRPAVLLSIGIAAYLLFIVVVGGDFMRGRFFVPLFVTAYVMAAVAFVRNFSLPANPRVIGGLAAAVVLLAVAGLLQAPPQVTQRDVPVSGIVNERLFYWPKFSFNQYLAQGMLDRQGGERLVRSIEAYIRACGPVTIHARNPNYLAYHVGPQLTAIDLHGLNDRYIASLPNDLLNDRLARPGHQVWRVPVKYLAERRSVTLIPDYGERILKLDCTLSQEAYEKRNDPGFINP